MAEVRGGGEGSEMLEEVEQEAAEVLPAPPGNPRFLLLDSLRALAAISVMLVHVGIFTGGFEPWYKQLFAHLDIGVPFFFLLSGFLLYRPMLASKVLELPRRRLRDYARNRFFRIMPLFWFVLTVTAIVPGQAGPFSGNWWVYYGLLDKFPIYTPTGTCAVNPFGCGVPPSWSLSLEVGFYILLPLFAAGVFWLIRLAGRRHWVAASLGPIAVISVLSFWIQSEIPLDDFSKWLFYSPLGRAFWFGLGMALATISVLSQQRGEAPSWVRWLAGRPGLCWGVAGFGYVATSLLLLDPGPSLNYPTTARLEYLSEYLIFGLVSAFVLLPAVFGREDRGLPARILRHPVLIWLGLISYGIFLWHFAAMAALLKLGILDLWPAMQFPVLAVSTFLLTVALSAITHYAIERPLITWARSRGRLRRT